MTFLMFRQQASGIKIITPEHHGAIYKVISEFDMHSYVAGLIGEISAFIMVLST